MEQLDSPRGRFPIQPCLITQTLPHDISLSRFWEDNLDKVVERGTSRPGSDVPVESAQKKKMESRNCHSYIIVVSSNILEQFE